MNTVEHIDVLLVEDNRTDADLTLRALGKAGFEDRLKWVQDGVEALDFVYCRGEYADRDPRDTLKLILLDLKMPRLDGMDVLRQLKFDAATRAIPIVVMTSSNQSRDVAASYRLGANGYITKPIQDADLRSAVSELVTFWLRVNRVP